MTDRLEEELRRALVRVEPPDGFADRVAAAAGGSRPAPWWRLPRLALAAAACLLLLAAGMAVEHRRQCEWHAQGEAARNQVMLALRITAAKLHVAQARMVRPAQGGDRL